MKGILPTVSSYAERNSCKSLKECNGDIDKNLLESVWTDRKSKQNFTLLTMELYSSEVHFLATVYKRGDN